MHLQVDTFPPALMLRSPKLSLNPLQTLIWSPLSLGFLRPSSFIPLQSVVVQAITRRPLVPVLTLFHSFLFPTPYGADDSVVLCIQPLQTDIKAFRTGIGYPCYQRTKRAACIEPDVERLQQKMRRKVGFPCQTLEPLSGWTSCTF